MSTWAPDFVLTYADGSVRDTKAEREAEQAALVADLAPKIAKSPILRDLCRSYAKAVTDPADEFVHLYEIRDRLKRHYGGHKEDVFAALNCEGPWRTLGKLSNSAPVSESRHRGLHDPVRPATEDELRKARDAALELIKAFAQTI